jgi:hypothetical protein
MIYEYICYDHSTKTLIERFKRPERVVAKAKQPQRVVAVLKQQTQIDLGLLHIFGTQTQILLRGFSHFWGPPNQNE